jgi:hypothetical protein
MAWGLLLLGGISDAADGWLARRAGGGSAWGAQLDPLTDKILISAPLLWLAASGSQPKPVRMVIRVHSSRPQAPARPRRASRRTGQAAVVLTGRIQRSSSNQTQGYSAQ